MHKITFKQKSEETNADTLEVGQLFVRHRFDGAKPLSLCLGKGTNRVLTFDLNDLAQRELTSDALISLPTINVLFQPKMCNPYSAVSAKSMYQIQAPVVREPQIGEFFHYNNLVYLRISNLNSFCMTTRTFMSLDFWDFDEQPVPIAEAEFMID